ncbi:hypothetical protein CAPTEDRAFT_202877 [Capitella teleta]|uniref:Neurotransmitter-gated ion-channel ligand-binding domain-containing protein n=1 Tax=Capitella teleta TaxID=283909 RepID=R7URT9_CAPTE|nr:hypothetical protein CAPTEDRAFT_202877 [Capitella teleta]|eukprot:ELU06091.1 hypothetical protein CAPTEDRAFT_202877 [Capitella teleta]
MADSESTSEIVILPPKRKVVLHVTFLKVGEINTMKEAFDADILLRAKWREPELDKCKVPILPENYDFDRVWNPKIYIDNIIGEPKRTSNMRVEYEGDGEAYCVERRRVKGTFMETMELYEFPFDVQDLSITIMSDCPQHDVELDEDPSESHKVFKRAFIDEQEWYLYKYIDAEKQTLMKDRADPTLMASALHVNTKVARRPWYFVWNNFSLTLLITCLSFVTFAVPPSMPQNRLQITFTLVLTAVAFKFVVNQSLPRISYLTYLDRYILFSMITLTVTAFWHGIQTLLPSTTSRGESVDHIALLIIGGFYFLYNLQFFIRLYVLPFRKRRDMEKLESKYEKKVRDEAAEKIKKRKTIFKKRNLLHRHKKPKTNGGTTPMPTPAPTPLPTPAPTPVIVHKEQEKVQAKVPAKEPAMLTVKEAADEDGLKSVKIDQ